jgi:micrococcal nuclease
MKISPLLKLIVVSAIVAGLGYLGLTVSPEQVEEAIDQQLAKPAAELAAEDGIYAVVSVIDGDTFVAERAGDEVTVRVIGIDAPETEFSPSGAECYGVEATEAAERLLTGASVTLQTDPTQDRYDSYDRLLAYAGLPDGRDFGAVMIETGFAEEFTFIQPYQKQSVYRAAESTARRVNVGVWTCQDGL